MHSFSLPRRFALIAAAVAILLPFGFARAALADDGDVADAAGVARISLIDGSVAVQRGDTSSPSAAAINAPVLAGDYITTGDGSRAEVEVDGATLVRLGQNVQLRFTHLDNDNRAIQLAEGTIDLRLLRGTDGLSDIDTPSVTVRPRAGGSYRVTVTADGATLVTVRSGDAEIVTPQGARALTPGATLYAQGPSSNPTITQQEAIALDDFDRFNADRDARFEHVAAADRTYVDPNIVGTNDLDAYGRWVPDAGYGEVWVPANVASDWAPYRDGRWVWEDPFGWTWVAAEPWGWAPYHYGSWYHSPAYGWAWYPPRPGVYVPWRPALVAFVSFGGGGSSFGVGYAAGGFGLSIGWVPLAPFEPYHPWWGRGWGGNTTIINNTTIVNNNFTHTYRNALYGVASVPGRQFSEGRFEHPTIVGPGELRHVDVVRGALPVVPTNANLRFSERAVPAQLAVRPTTMQRTFAGAPVAARRVPFEQQRAAIAGVTHLPYVPQAGAHGAAGASDVPRGEAVRGNDPWSRFGENHGAVTTHAVAPATAGTGAATHSGAWGRFEGGAGEGTARVDTHARSYDNAPRGYDNSVRTTTGSGGRTYDPQTRPARTYDAARPYDATRTNDSAARNNRAYDAHPAQTPSYARPAHGYEGGGSAHAGSSGGSGSHPAQPGTAHSAQHHEGGERDGEHPH